MIFNSFVLYPQIKLLLNTGKGPSRFLCLLYLPQTFHDKIKKRGFTVRNNAFCLLPGFTYR